MTDLQQTVRGLRLAKLRHDHGKLAKAARLDQEPPFGPRCALGIALWFGLLIGLAEVVLTRVQKPLTDPSPGLFRMNRHIMWTIPTVDLVVFGFCGLVAALVLRARPRLGVRGAVGPVALLGMLTLLLSCRWLHVLACLVLAFLFAFRLTRRIEASFPAFRRLVRRTMPAMAGLVAAMIGLSLGGQIPGVRQAAAPPPAVSAGGQDAPGPNVLLVVLDTVRADHLESSWLRPRYVPQSIATGPTRDHVQAGAVDGSLDSAFSRQHDDRPLAP